MSENYVELAVPPPALSCAERSPAFVNPCLSRQRSHNIPVDRFEDHAEQGQNEGSGTNIVQVSDNEVTNTEDVGSGFTAHFVSNGYYGFQPLSVAVTEVDCHMDMDELNSVEGEEGSSCHEILANGNSFEPYRWQKPHTGIESKHKSFTVLGKRNWDGVTEIHTDIKRIRHEEPSSLTVCLFQGVDCAKMSAEYSDILFSERSPNYPSAITQYV